MSKKVPGPFSCITSPQIPELLYQLNCSIAFTSFQSGKLVFVSATSADDIVQLPRSFDKPMGLAVKNDTIALVCKDKIVTFRSDLRLALNYPKKKKTYDKLFVPTSTYHTGQLDLHDLHWLGHDLVAVNTAFSCLIKIDPSYNFVPIWQPKFISDLASEDRCHLNGMAVQGNQIKYVTALSDGNTASHWRQKIPGGGLLMDVDTHEIIVDDLHMPHSPRIYNQQVYLLEAAKGELVKINPNNGQVEPVFQKNGFARGLAKYQDYIFIGYSKLRKRSSSFGKLPFSDQAHHCGISIIHEPTGALVGELQYATSVDEIYDIQIIPNCRRPNILNPQADEEFSALITPDASFWGRSRK